MLIGVDHKGNLYLINHETGEAVPWFTPVSREVMLAQRQHGKDFNTAFGKDFGKP